MKRFIIEESFLEVFDDFRIGVIVLKGINNHKKGEDDYRSLLDDAQRESMKYYPDEDFSSNEVIKVWREAYSRFKTKKGARSSIEALLKRVAKGNSIGTINPLVDIYNAISLKYGLPCGGEDIDKFVGDVRLTKAMGNEEFITYGSDLSEPPYQGEIVYKDDKGAICRCFNYRECVRTCLEEDTVNAFMVIETVDQKSMERLNGAIEEMASLISKHLGGEATVYYLDKNNREIIIEE
ncbi:MAG: B3/4 domain-containing protein [Firmicutes bacterium]|nr:B3/4 domain-containing protein [Bacillota bacterium]